MANTDPLADMFTRIRNAVAVRKTSVSLPYSKMKQTVAQVLVDTHFVDSLAVEGEGVEKNLVIVINTMDSNARITTIDRMSTPGRRMYVAASEIPTVKQGRGMVIVSTSHGVMSGTDAKQKRLGGELIAKIS